MQDLDTVLLLLLLRIVLGLAVLPGGESCAPGGVVCPNCAARQCETRTVRKCVASLRFSGENSMMSALKWKTASEMHERLRWDLSSRPIQKSTASAFKLLFSVVSSSKISLDFGAASLSIGSSERIVWLHIGRGAWTIGQMRCFCCWDILRYLGALRGEAYFPFSAKLAQASLAPE